MKRGFLNSSKAKAKLTKDMDRIRLAVCPVPKPELVRASYGFVKNAGIPEGYKTTQELDIADLDPFAPTENYDKDTILYTTQPPRFMDATSADFPDGWTECILFADVKGLILATPGFPSPLVRPSSTKYRLASSPNKGLGLFSTGKICAGDLILSERPLTLVPTWTVDPIKKMSRELTPDETFQALLYEWEQSLKVIFGRMQPDRQAAFMALANSHQQDGSGPLGGIIRTNGLGVENLQTGRFSAEEQRTRKGVYNAVCKEISRVNHSCSPNTVAYFDIPTFSYRLTAVRDIVEGEELTLSYVDLMLFTKSRQLKLEPYGFQCTCMACREPLESDSRRAIISRTKTDNLEGGLIKLSLLEKEGLEATEEYSETLKSIMGFYIFGSHPDTAAKYAGKLLKRAWSRAACSTALSNLISHPMWDRRSPK
ncbi:hypothetical protein DFH09DRAFT_1027153 [Mycena vulgaris]|nr:hypothetical protein DFH09DRAFT_1027153 [Mycena vulgaris]